MDITKIDCYKGKLVTAIIFLSILIVSIAVYWTSFDDFLVEEDAKVLKPESATSLLKHFYTRDWFYYRPLLQVVWSLEWFLFNNNMLGYHLVNFILNFINVYLVYRIGLILFNDYRIAIIASIVFAFHPTHTEDLIWASALVDNIPPLFYFLGLIYFLQFLKEQENPVWKHYFLGILYFILSLLSKEMAFSFPLAIIVFDFIQKPKSFFNKDGIKKKVLIYLPFVIITLIYFWFRIATEFGGIQSVPDFGFKFYIKNICEALRRLTLPAGMLSVFFVFFLFLFPKNKNYLYSFLFVFISLIPVVPSLMKDRYLYLPSLGTSLIMAYIIVYICFELKWSSSKLASKFKIILCSSTIVIILVSSVHAIKIRMKDVEFRSYQASIVPKGLKNYYSALPENSRVYMILLPKYNIIPEILRFVEIEKGVYFEYLWKDFKFGLLSDFFKEIWNSPLPSDDKIYFFRLDNAQIIESSDFKKRLYSRENLFRSCSGNKADEIRFDFSEKNKNLYQISSDVNYSFNADGSLEIDKKSDNAKLVISLRYLAIDNSMINSVLIKMSASDEHKMSIPMYFVWNDCKKDKEYYELVNVKPSDIKDIYTIGVGYNYSWIMEDGINNVELVFDRVPKKLILDEIRFSCNKTPYVPNSAGIDIFNPK
jgi:hypothetical protein